jgi:hypothetical protein
MPALITSWFLVGILAIPCVAIAHSFRRALLVALVWALPFAGPLAWHDIRASIARTYFAKHDARAEPSEPASDKPAAKNLS